MLLLQTKAGTAHHSAQAQGNVCLSDREKKGPLLVPRTRHGKEGWSLRLSKTGRVRKSSFLVLLRQQGLTFCSEFPKRACSLFLSQQTKTRRVPSSTTHMHRQGGCRTHCSEDRERALFVQQWWQGWTIAHSDREGALCSAMTGRVYYYREQQGRCTLFSYDRKGVLLDRDTEGALLSSKQSCSAMTGSVYYCRKWQGRCTLVQQTKLFSNDRKGALY